MQFSPLFFFFPPVADQSRRQERSEADRRGKSARGEALWFRMRKYYCSRLDFIFFVFFHMGKNVKVARVALAI